MRARGMRSTPRHLLAAAAPFVPIPGLATPASILTVPSKLSYWLNDVDGDCVTAETAASLVAFSIWGKGAADPTVWIDDDAVFNWAVSHRVLNGADLSQVMTWMEKDPMRGSDGRQYIEGPHYAVNYASDVAMQQAMISGPLKLGVAADQLENVVGQSNGWVLDDATPDNNYDHCISAFGYGPFADCCKITGATVSGDIDPAAPAYLLFTWRTVGVALASSLVNICGEAWLRRPTGLLYTQGS